MKKKDKIFIAGHKGMVGSAIFRLLDKRGYRNIIIRSRDQLDLLNQNDVQNFFNHIKPKFVFVAAAKVGGVYANNTYRAQFLYENLVIQNNIIHSAYMSNTEKLLFLGSACIYPKEIEQPIIEEYLLSNSLEPTNEPYAIAKIAGIKLCENYFNQYGKNFISIMPNNLFGTNDNFDLKTSHVLPALLRKFHEAKLNNSDFVEIWGTGKPMREFLYVDDLADASVFLMKNLNAQDLHKMRISHINVGSGFEISIRDLALLIKGIVKYKGKMKFNKNFPDGMQRKLLDTTRIKNLGWVPKTNLEDGIKSVYNWYCKKN
ncbi:MAG: GDP-fucose synthetase [Candidatus Marinimicrobia bacterium]|nr:GDP-fucose synthetase [Candidatus Neomarinimicrobiota bacterium]